LAWYGKKNKKLNLRQKKCTTPQNKHKKIKPGLVAFYDIWQAWKWSGSILEGIDK